jgi:hypothetical protein
VLARNVVLLGLRRALQVKTSTHGTEAIALSTYTEGIKHYVGPNGCPTPNQGMDYLKAALPGWKFVYRNAILPSLSPGTPAPTPNPASACETASKDQELGAGTGVMLGKRFVLAPSAEVLNEGTLEQPASLRVALDRYRKLAETRALHGIASLMPPTSTQDPTFMIELITSGCLSGQCQKK